MDISSIEKAFSAVCTAYEIRKNGANIMGINMEGPYINPDRAGAQDPTCVRPANIDEFRRLNALSGNLVKLITVAPEVPGNLAFIREVVKEGVSVSCGHSSAKYDTIMLPAIIPFNLIKATSNTLLAAALYKVLESRGIFQKTLHKFVS